MEISFMEERNIEGNRVRYWNRFTIPERYVPSILKKKKVTWCHIKGQRIPVKLGAYQLRTEQFSRLPIWKRLWLRIILPLF